MVRTRWPVALFVVWSAFVWLTRIRNVLGDDTADKPFGLALSVSVLAPVAATGVVLVAARSRRLREGEVRLWRATAGWTALVWLVRGAEIAASDHELGFKVVHVVIGALSVVLAAATWRVAGREPVVTAGGRPGVSPPVGAGR